MSIPSDDDRSGPSSLVREKEKHLAKRFLNGVTQGEARNGWDEQSLAQYISERDRSVSRVHRLGPHVDDKAPMRFVNTDSYNPHDW